MTEYERFQAFLERLRSQGKRPNTIAAYTQDYRALQAWCSAGATPMDLASFSLSDAQAYRQSLLTAEAKPATINRRLTFLKAYASAMLPELAAALKDLKPVRQQPLAPKSLPVEDVRVMLDRIQRRGTPRDYALVSFMLHTGIRVGELCQLRRADVRDTSREWACGIYGLVIVRADTAKGGKQRAVPVCRAAREALNTYLAQRHDTNPALFLGHSGEPLTESGVAQLLRRYAPVHPHQLRHTFAYQYLKANSNDLVGLAAILGHESIATTQRYTQRRMEDLEAGAENVKF